MIAASNRGLGAERDSEEPEYKMCRQAVGVKSISASAIAIAWMWPHELVEIWSKAGQPAVWPIDLGSQEESTVPYLT
jgi:hypothetical protein